ncbi:MAG: hypothetical protein QXY90_06650 [Candidatus Anstonellales archaeon]
MIKSFCKKTSLLILLFFWMIPLIGFSNEEVIKTKGILMEMDLKTQTLIINEKKFKWDSNTAIEDEKGYSIKMESLKPNTPIYAESVEDPLQKRLLIKKIRLIKKVK